MTVDLITSTGTTDKINTGKNISSKWILKFFNFEIDLILLNLIDFETNFLPQY
jgi:hypothetical protein